MNRIKEKIRQLLAGAPIKAGITVSGASISGNFVGGKPVADKDVLDAYDAGGYKWLSDRELEYQLIKAASTL